MHRWHEGSRLCLWVVLALASGCPSTNTAADGGTASNSGTSGTGGSTGTGGSSTGGGAGGTTTGSSSGGTTSGGSGGAGGLCQAQHAGQTSDGDPVVICDQLYAQRPLVRPPADVTSGSNATLYGVVDLVRGAFFDRLGNQYLVVDTQGSPMNPVVSYPAGFEMPSNRGLYLIYRVAGTVTPFDGGGPGTPSATLQVSGAAPAILID